MPEGTLSKPPANTGNPGPGHSLVRAQPKPSESPASTRHLPLTAEALLPGAVQTPWLKCVSVCPTPTTYEPYPQVGIISIAEASH